MIPSNHPNQRTLSVNDQAVARDRFQKMVKALKAGSLHTPPRSLSAECQTEIAALAQHLAAEYRYLVTTSLQDGDFGLSEDQVRVTAQTICQVHERNLIVLITERMRYQASAGLTGAALAAYYMSIYCGLQFNSNRASISVNIPGPNGIRTVRLLSRKFESTL